jgi:hypothetical protein
MFPANNEEEDVSYALAVAQLNTLEEKVCLLEMKLKKANLEREMYEQERVALVSRHEAIVASLDAQLSEMQKIVSTHHGLEKKHSSEAQVSQGLREQPEMAICVRELQSMSCLLKHTHCNDEDTVKVNRIVLSKTQHTDCILRRNAFAMSSDPSNRRSTLSSDRKVKKEVKDKSDPIPSRRVTLASTLSNVTKRGVCSVRPSPTPSSITIPVPFGAASLASSENVKTSANGHKNVPRYMRPTLSSGNKIRVKNEHGCQKTVYDGRTGGGSSPWRPRKKGTTSA